MKYKTSELTGALLDAAVAKAELKDFGLMSYISDMMDHGLTGVDKETGLEVCYAPSTDWRHGGPIIERERIDLSHAWPGSYFASIGRNVTAEIGQGGSYYGDTPLIAAMRAYVASKLGYEVEL